MQKNFEIEIDGFTFNVIFSESRKRTIPLLLLHGFTGRASDLSFLAEFLDEKFIIIAPDLPGHGASYPVENIADYEIDVIVARLKKLLETLEFDKAVLLGYSMGGRIAYAFSERYPQNVAALIIESATPGIEDEKERAERKIADEKLADMIMEKGVYNFVEFWLSLPIFESLKNIDKRLYEKIRAEKVSNKALGLANSLRATGTGNMKPVWKALPRFTFPTLLINGKLDEKYSEINRKVIKLIPNSSLIEMDGAGHNVHIEKPHEYITLVNGFLEKNFAI